MLFFSLNISVFAAVFLSFVYFPRAPTRRAWPPRSIQLSSTWL